MKLFRKKFILLVVVGVMVFQSIVPARVYGNESQDIPNISYNTDEPVWVVGGLSGGENYSSEVTYTKASDAIQYNVGIKSASTGDTITIDIPVGINLVSVPGLTFDANGNMSLKDYNINEQEYFEGKPNFEKNDGVGSSGTLTYTLKDAQGITFDIQTKINEQLVPFSNEDRTIKLGEVVATYGENSATTTVFVKTVGSEITIKPIDSSEYYKSVGSTFSKKLTSTFIAADRTFDIATTIDMPMTPAIAEGKYEFGLLELSFDVMVPEGATITPKDPGLFTTEIVETVDGYTKHRLKMTKDFSIKDSVKFSNFMIFNFSNVKENDVPGKKFTITVKNVTFLVKSYNYETGEYETIDITNQDATSSNTVVVSPLVDNEKYSPSYYTAPNLINTEKLNPFNNEAQLLFQAERRIGQYNAFDIKNIPAGTTQNILLNYVAIPDETKGYLDNVSLVVMRVPFLGEKGIERYASQLESIRIWYESDDIGELGITSEAGHQLDIEGFKKAMLAGELTVSESITSKQVDSQGIVSYIFNSKATPYFNIYSPKGESIVKVEIEIKGDTKFYFVDNNDSSLIYGLPKIDTYTGDYSKYQFNTYVKDEAAWSKKASSSVGGFRWAKPDPFALTITDTSLNNALYQYNVAKYNTVYKHPKAPKQHSTNGYQNLGSISISNQTGTPLEENQYVVFEFLAQGASINDKGVVTFDKSNRSPDVIKKIQLPTCSNLGEESIQVVAYQYANGSKHYYSSDSGAPKPYVLETDSYGNQYLVLKATGDNEIVHLQVALSSWGADTTSSSFGLFGYIDDTSNLQRDDQHRLSYTVYDDNRNPIEGLSESTIVNSTFKNPGKTGADVRIKGLDKHSFDGTSYTGNYLVAGRSSDIQFELIGGLINNVNNGYWHDITFNIVLPKGMNLDGINGLKFGYDYKGTDFNGIPTKELIGKITTTKKEIGAAEAAAYFGDDDVKGATVYTCTLEDREAILYGVRIGDEAYSFSKMTFTAKITPDLDMSKTLIPWNKVLLLGSNYEGYTDTDRKEQAPGGFSTNFYPEYLTGENVNLLKNKVGSGEDLPNYENSFKVGKTTNIVTGASDEYLVIDSKSELMVHDLSLNTEQGEFVYNPLDKDTVAILHAADTGTLHYKVSNTITHTGANKLDSYVIVSLPTNKDASNKITTQSDFEVDITGIKVNDKEVFKKQNTRLATSDIEVKYMNSAGADVSGHAEVKELFDNASSKYSKLSDHDYLILKVENQTSFESFDIEVDFTMPTHITTATEYVEFHGLTTYCISDQGRLDFDSKEDASSSIRFGYENPEWIVDVKPVVINEAGYITGSLDTAIEDLKVPHNNLVYDNDDSRDHYLKAPVKVGYTFDNWYLDEDLTKPAFKDGEKSFKVSSNMTVYACYTVNKVDVTYDFNNDKSNETKTVDWDSIVKNPETPSKKGFTFSGWYIDKDCKIPLVAKTYGEVAQEQSSITIYAGYTKNPVHGVIYDVEGFEDTTKYEEKEIVTVLTDIPEKEGYEFIGWFYNSTVYKPGAILAMGKDDITFVSQWKEKEYTVSYQDEDGTTLKDDETHDYKSIFTLTAPAAKKGYTFKGWEYNSTIYPENSSFPMPYRNVVFTAKWEINSYKLTLENVLEGELTDFTYENDVYFKELKYNQEITLPTPVREGYTFVNWSNGDTTYDKGSKFTMTDSDTTLTANWEVINYKVSYDCNGGKDIESSSHAFGSTIPLPTPTYAGHHFLHWVDQDGNEYIAGNDYDIPSHNTNFTAVWKVKKHEVIFKDEGESGHIYFDEEVDGNGSIKMPLPQKEGYTFNHWTYNGEDYKVGDIFVMPDMDESAIIHFTANWKIKQYEVTFDTTDIENAVEYTTIKQNYNSDVSLSTATPKKDGNTFLYWSDGVNHYKVGADFKMPAGGLKLHPVWEINEYTLSFTQTGDTTFDSQKLEYNTTIQLPIPHREGYDFIGWQNGDSMHDAYGSFTMPAKDVEFVGIWEVHKYDVIYDYNYNDKEEVVEYSYGDNAEFDHPVRTGYTFKGWFYDGTTYYKDDIFTVTKKDIKFVAVWEINSYKLTLENVLEGELTDFTYENDVYFKELKYNQEITLPTPVREGYTFVNWSNGDTTYDKGSKFTMTDSDTTLTANWTVNEYKVSYDCNGGKDIESSSHAFGSTIPLPTPTYAGHHFLHWVDQDGTEYIAGNEYDIPSHNTKFTAVWQVKKHEIIFKDEGESGHIYFDEEIDGNGSIEMPLPQKEGYTFNHWTYNGEDYKVGEVFVMPDMDESAIIHFIANWKVNQYEVTFDTTDIENAEEYTTIKQNYNSDVSLSTVTPQKEGYTFLYWSDGVNHYEVGADFKMPAGGLKLHPVWEINEYTLSFENTGDSIIDDVVLEYNETTDLPTPTKKGYNFDGWYDQSDNKVKDPFTMNDEDVTLRAKWSKKSYDITFDYDYENKKEVVSMEYDLIIPLEDPTRGGYTFKGWSYNGKTYTSVDEIKVIDGNMEFKAVWESNEFTLSFENTGDSSIDDVVLEYNETYDLPTPVREGYTFVNWSNGDTTYDKDSKFTMTDSDTTLTANWEVINYKVSYDCNGGKDIESSSHAFGSTITLPTPTYAGHHFLHWVDQDGNEYIAGNKYDIPSHNTKFTAVWQVKKHEIIFKDEGELGHIYFDEEVDGNGSIEMPLPQKEGYTFNYWTYNGKNYKVDEVFKMPDLDKDSIIHFIANWTVNEYKVSYDCNGGKDIESSSYPFESTIKLPTPTYAGHHFLHWVDQDGTKYIAGNEYDIPSHDTKFTAVWQVKKHEIIFKDEGESGHIYFDEEIDGNGSIEMPLPQKEGYTFNHWTYNGKDYKVDDVFVMPDMDESAIIHFIANWKINQYEVTFDTTDIKNADEYTTIKHNYKSDVTLSTVTPQKEGYTFLYWSDGVNHYEVGADFKMPAGGLKLHPVWEINEYTLSFENTGDTVIEDVVLEYNEEFKIPTVTKDGYTFVKWIDSNGVEYDANEMINVAASNMEFTAVWIKNEEVDDNNDILPEEDKDDNDADKDDTVAPGTGDITPVTIYGSFFALSTIVLVVLFTKKRQTKKQ